MDAVVAVNELGLIFMKVSFLNPSIIYVLVMCLNVKFTAYL